jgi:hypothetical protein
MNETAKKTLQSIEQKTVLFYDDELIAILGSDNNIYISIRHLCELLGLDRRGQVQRIERTTILERGFRSGALQTKGGEQMVGLLRVDLLPMWLSGLRTKSIRPEMKSRIERLQDEAAKVLWEAFQEGRLTSTPPIEDLLRTDSPAAQAYKMALAMAELARNQLLLEARLDQRLDDHETRIEQLEVTISDSARHISPDQAMQLSQAVKTVAMELGKQTRRNEYGGVYGELYRKFGITSYKLLPANKFANAMGWLEEWFSSLTDSNNPF